VVLSVGGMMVITLVPGPVGSFEQRPDALAEIGDYELTVTQVRQQMARIERRQSIPRPLQAFYARQIVEQLIFERALELEAQRLGIRVTDEERVERIKRLLPVAFAGDTFIGMDRYAAEVQQRFDLTVAEFEEIIRKSLLEEKFRRLVTDGVTVPPEEVFEEFRRRNEKATIEYAVIRPEAMQARVPVSEADLAQYFEKNKARYQVPERRVVRLALLDLHELRQRAGVTDEELRAYYNQQVDRYRIQNRARVSHILFKTVGKSDAEIAEVRAKAEDVLKNAKRGAKFEELAKQYSEDTTKENGGDLGWILQGQTVAEFEQAAFSLPKGTISDLVKTQYGFHIVKVVDRETARTQSFEEVRASIVPIVAAEKAERMAQETGDKLAAAVRQSNRRPIDELAKQFGLSVTETRPLAATDPVGELGNAPEVRDVVFRLRVGELSSPIQTDRGYVVLSVKGVQPQHQGTLAEVRDRVEADLRGEKAGELAKAQAEALASRVQAGEAFAKAAKALGFEAKTSEPFARVASVPDLGSTRQIPSAFTLPPGKSSPALLVGGNWVVFRVVSREEAKTEDFARQQRQIEQQVLDSQRSIAYDAFRKALEDRLKREGKLRINQENYKRLTSPT
jgi:peptidyl-prolyl cis-trans isomerase D